MNNVSKWASPIHVYEIISAEWVSKVPMARPSFILPEYSVTFAVEIKRQSDGAFAAGEASCPELHQVLGVPASPAFWDQAQFRVVYPAFGIAPLGIGFDPKSHAVVRDYCFFDT